MKDNSSSRDHIAISIVCYYCGLNVCFSYSYNLHSRHRIGTRIRTKKNDQFCFVYLTLHLIQ